MEQFKYYYNTESRISAALNVPINQITMPSIIFNLVWSAYYNISHNEDAIVSYIKQWLTEHGKPLQLPAYAKIIKSSIAKMKDMPWRDFSGTVKIRKSELEYISSFGNIKMEKLLFCYLAIAKFNDIFRKKPTHWENEKDSVVFKMARVNIPSSERDYFINDLIIGSNAKFYMGYSNNDTSKRVDFISDNEDDEIILELAESNYYELAYTYLNWKNGGGYKECNKCGRLFKIKTSKLMRDSDGRSSNTQYCEHCAPKNEPLYKGKGEPKEIACVDCGKTVYLNNFADSRTCYCDECYQQHRRRQKAEEMRKLRAKL